MDTLKVSSDKATLFISEKDAFERNFDVTICVVSSQDGSLLIRCIGNLDKCRKMQKVILAFTKRTFTMCHRGLLSESDRWSLMKSFDVYAHNITDNEEFEICSEDSSTLSKAKDKVIPHVIECITLDDSQNSDVEIVETKTDVDDSILFIGSFPGQPAKRRKKILNGTNAQRVEMCKSLGLPYSQNKYVSCGRCPLPIAIDGSNVAREHGKPDNTFSCIGIKIAVDYFISLGHFPVRAFVPRYIKERSNHCKVPVKNSEILDDLVRQNKLTLTPSSEEINGKLTVPYDDRFILNYACIHNAVVLSNDRFRDIASENSKFTFIARQRLLMFSFAGDLLMIPTDPKGRRGPTLLEYISEPSRKLPNNTSAPLGHLKRINASRILTHMRKRNHRRRRSGRNFTKPSVR